MTGPGVFVAIAFAFPAFMVLGGIASMIETHVLKRRARRTQWEEAR